MNTIYDFYEYFRGDWAYALYHDRFHMLTELNNKLIYNSHKSDNQDQFILLNNIRKCIIDNKWEKVNKNGYKICYKF